MEPREGWEGDREGDEAAGGLWSAREATMLATMLVKSKGGALPSS